MEEVTKYYHRQNNGIDVINPRLSSVAPDENMPPLRRVTTLSQWLRVKGLNVTHPAATAFAKASVSQELQGMIKFKRRLHKYRSITISRF